MGASSTSIVDTSEYLQLLEETTSCLSTCRQLSKEKGYMQLQIHRVCRCIYVTDIFTALRKMTKKCRVFPPHRSLRAPIID